MEPAARSPLRIVAGTVASDVSAAHVQIIARLQEHGLVSPRCETVTATQDWTTTYPEGLSDLFDPDDGASCFALLDAAAVPNLATLIEASGLDYRCLFRGETAQDLQDVSPWIVRLTPGTKFTRNLFTHDPDTTWMLWGRISPILLRSADRFIPDPRQSERARKTFTHNALCKV